MLDDQLAALLALAFLPAAATLLLVGFRRPLHVLLPCFAAVVPYGSALAPPGLPPRYASASSLLGYALIAALAWKFVSGRWQVGHLPLAVPVWLLFVAVAGATTFWSLEPQDSAVSFVTMAGIVVLYLLVKLSPVDRDCLVRTERAVLLGGVAGGCYALYQLVFGALPEDLAGTPRFGEELTDPNHLASALTLPVALAAWRVVTAGTRNRRVAYVATVAVLLLAIVLTGSRGGTVAAVLAIAVTVALSPRRATAMVSTGLAVAVLAVPLMLSPSLTPDRLTDTDPTSRTRIWLVGLHSCPDHCLMGSGWSTFGDAYAAELHDVPSADVSGRGQLYLEAHNIWILALVETGVLGFMLMTFGLSLSLREAIRLPAAMRGPPLAAVTALLVTAMLLSNLEFKYFWMVLVYISLVSGQTPQGPTPRGHPRQVTRGRLPGVVAPLVATQRRGPYAPWTERPSVEAE